MNRQDCDQEALRARCAQLERALGERRKELMALYGLSDVVNRHGHDLDRVLRGVLALIPPSWQWPERTAARIMLGERELCDPRFRDDGLVQSQSINVEGAVAGRIEVALLGGPPDGAPPFLAEEGELLRALAERIGAVAVAARRDERLRESERRHRLLVEQAPDAIVLLGPGGRFLEANPATTRLLGYTREELRGLRFRDLLPPEDADARPFDVAGLQRGQRVLGTRRLRCRDGSTAYVETSTVLVGEGHAQVIARDVSERVRAEQELLRSHRENSHLLGVLPCLLVVVDRDDEVLRWNGMSAATLGLEADETLGRRLHDLPLPLDRAVLGDALARCREAQRRVQIEELAYERPGTASGLLSLTVEPLAPEAGEPGDVIVLGTEITELRQLQTAMASAQRLEAIGQLAAGIAHEINTPLQYLGDNLQFLSGVWDEEAAAMVEERVDDADERAFLKQEIPRALLQAREGLEHVSQIVAAMKEFSHPGSATEQVVDLNRIVESTATVSRNEWKDVAEMELDLAPDLPSVPGLPRELGQALLNLVVNAAHAVAAVVTPGGRGRITVRTRRAGDGVEVEVRDTGAGIPEAVRPRIFDPFFTTKEVGQGTGQGLAIARSAIVDKHGGELDFETETGRGTTFRIRLPG